VGNAVIKLAEVPNVSDTAVPSFHGTAVSLTLGTQPLKVGLSPFTCFSYPAKFKMTHVYSPAGYYSEVLLYRKIRIDLDIRGGVTEMVLRKENQGKCCSVGWHKKGHGPASTSCVRIYRGR
jgi:hypothetical protein